jgi:hypothetical protein
MWELATGNYAEYKAAREQQTPMPVVGFVDNTSAAGRAQYVATFRQGLKEKGFVEGQNVGIEFRWAEGQNYK